MRKLAIPIAAAVAAGALVGSPAAGGPTTGGLATDNIEHVRHIPLAQNGVGGRLIGKWFYMNDQNKVMIWDVSDPLDPQMTGFVPMPQEWQFSREDIDGNGKILVVPNTASGQNDGNPQTTSPINAVYIIDVEDKTNPTIISKVPGVAEHTYSCVLDCTYAWGSSGTIIDLRNPAKPKVLKEKWGDGTTAGSGGHDVEEVAPGLVMTSTNPLVYLDARKNPLKPKVLAFAGTKDGAYMHANLWPRGGKDDFLLHRVEVIGPANNGEPEGVLAGPGARRLGTVQLRSQHSVGAAERLGSAGAGGEQGHAFDDSADHRDVEIEVARGVTDDRIELSARPGVRREIAPDPEAFRPERWLDGLARRLPKYAYFPFGGGPRQCIGKGFALMEATLVLALLEQRYDLHLVPGRRVETVAMATLRPRHFKPVAALENGLTDPTCGMIMGKTAELLASEFGIARREQDEFALRSHERATAAISAAGYVPSRAGQHLRTQRSHGTP